jgi:cytochrome P450
MSFFPVLKLDDLLDSLYTKNKRDIKDIRELEEDLVSKTAERRRISQRLREILPTAFDLPYIENVIFPALVTSAFQGERLSLPMIDPERHTKEEALPYFFWGMLYDNWEPNLEEEGLSVFIQGYENRGDSNHRKRIYYSALTPDLYRPMYGNKIVSFFNQLFSPMNANRPVMRQYLDTYFDLYWDLHLGVKGDDIPPAVRQIGESFNTVLAYVNPIEDIVHDNYVRVRALRQTLKLWIDERIDDLLQGQIQDPQKTFVYYWLKNGESGPDFRRKDVVFECFHNFVALSQWGNTIYQIMSRLSTNAGDEAIQESFRKTMTSNFDQTDGTAFTPLDRFVMELFRTISPNDGSISTLTETGNLEPLYPRYGYVFNPHKATSEDPRHWKNPTDFDPDRYVNAPTSDQIDEARAEQIGFAQCPFHQRSINVKDGRNTQITNSAFGTVYGITDDRPYPVCDYAGYAPFGFGYRRCPGEQFTVEFIKDFLRKVWNSKIEFKHLSLKDVEQVPVGPTTVVDDNIGFTHPDAI